MFKPLEIGDVVAVLALDGKVAYLGEIVSAPAPGSDAALFDRGSYGIWDPKTDKVHYVATADSKTIRRATDAEIDDYIDAFQA